MTTTAAACAYAFPNGRQCVADHSVAADVHEAPATVHAILDGSATGGVPGTVSLSARLTCLDWEPGCPGPLLGVVDLGGLVVEVRSQAEAQTVRAAFLDLAGEVETIGARLSAQQGDTRSDGRAGTDRTKVEVTSLVVNAIIAYYTQAGHDEPEEPERSWEAADIVEGAEEGLVTATRAATILDRCGEPDRVPGDLLEARHDAILSRIERDLDRLSAIYRHQELMPGGDYAARATALRDRLGQQIERNTAAAAKDIEAFRQAAADRGRAAAAG